MQIINTNFYAKDATNIDAFVVLAESATGQQNPLTASGLIYNTVSGVLQALNFTGSVTGLSSENAKILSSSYVGNNAVNRAIPHGLARIPQHVCINGDTGTACYAPTIINGRAYNALDTVVSYAVTSADIVNFYVGNASNFAQTGNTSNVVWQWMAIA